MAKQVNRSNSSWSARVFDFFEQETSQRYCIDPRQDRLNDRPDSFQMNTLENPIEHSLFGRVTDLIRALGRNLAIKFVQSSKPLILICRLACTEIDTQGAKIGSTALLRCAFKNICAPGDLEIDKSCLDNRHLELCFQQSAGNSASPEVNITLCVFGHDLLHQDVGYLQAAIWLEHSSHFSQTGQLIWHQV